MLNKIAGKTFEYIRLALFLAGVLIGVQLPSFVDQYKKSVQAHLLEARKNLSQFQADADKHFGGSMEKLIKHYLNQNDKIVRKGGQNLTEVYIRLNKIEAHNKKLKTAILGGVFEVIIFPDSEILDEVWGNYSYTVPLNSLAIIWGISAGLAFAILGDILLAVFIRITGIKRLITPRKLKT